MARIGVRLCIIQVSWDLEYYHRLPEVDFNRPAPPRTIQASAWQQPAVTAMTYITFPFPCWYHLCYNMKQMRSVLTSYIAGTGHGDEGPTLYRVTRE